MRVTRCVGVGAAIGCGWQGGAHGSVCPECGGTVLGPEAVVEAARFTDATAHDEADGATVPVAEVRGCLVCPFMAWRSVLATVCGRTDRELPRLRADSTPEWCPLREGEVMVRLTVRETP